MGSNIVDVSHLILRQAQGDGKSIAEVEVKPKDQVRVLLGEFTPQNYPRGFSVEFTPHPDNSMVSRVTSLESGDRQKLILHIANFGEKPVSGIVRLV